MGFISNILRGNAINLASTGASIGNPKSVVTPDKQMRIPKVEINNLYRRDFLTFNMVNLPLKTLMHAGYTIGTNSTTSSTNVRNFFDNIGKVGDDITESELVEYIAQDMIMYGEAFVERVYNQTDTKIVDLTMIDATRTDYAKDKQGNIAIDRYGKPLGYIISLPWGTSAEGKGDIVPKEFESIIDKDSTKIFLLPKRVAHFKLHSYGDRYYPVGLIEPAFNEAARKQKIEEARTNMIYTRGENPVIATVGNERHEAGPQEISGVLNQLKNLKHDRYFAFPDWVKVDTLEINESNGVEETLKYLIVSQATAAGIPLALATGSGEATNRSTLNNQQQMYEITLEYIANKIAEQFNKYILQPIAQTNKWSYTPQMKWGDVRAEEKNEKSKRLAEAVNIGAILPEEARQYMIKAEDITPMDREYKKKQKERKEIPIQKIVKEEKPSNDEEDKEDMEDKE